MIKNNKIKETKCDFFHENIFLFSVYDVVNFYDCLLQIRQEKSFNYYIVFKDEKILIDKNGTLEKYPIGLFDQYGDILCQMI